MVRVQFGAEELTVRVAETVLDACLRQGVLLPFSCRAGTCHTCMMRAPGASLPSASQVGIDAALRAKGYFLPCKCLPSEDMEMLPPDARDIAFDAILVERCTLSQRVHRLRFEPLRQLAMAPGQHVDVVHPNGAQRPYSIASLIEHDYFLDLHVDHHAHGLVSHWLCDQLQVGETVTMRAPGGNLSVRSFAPDSPLLLVATGTGAAPLLAMARQALLDEPGRHIQFVHGARYRDDLYLHDTLEALGATHAGFRYVPCLSAASAPGVFSGRVTDQLDRLELSPRLVCAIAGHPEMVDSMSVALCAYGIPNEHIVTEQFRVKQRAAAAPATNPELWTALAEGRLLQAALRVFYARVFADAKLSPYFRGVTEQRLIEKQYSFLRSLIIGSRDYFGQRPRNAHHWMVISDELFDYRLGLMRSALIEQGLEEPWLSQCHALEERFRADIVKAAPILRELDGEPLVQDGLAETTIDVGTICDQCQAVIEPGATVRYHQRLGTVYCASCQGGLETTLASP